MTKPKNIALMQVFKWILTLFVIGLVSMIISFVSMSSDNTHHHAQTDQSKLLADEQATNSMLCLQGLFDGPAGILKAHTINLDFTGRIAVGDLNSDNHLDFVVSNRNQLAAYDFCGNTLWHVDAETNWDHPNHVYWNWTSYGYIGDADGDNMAEFLHIGSDWQTLFVRNGKTGLVEHEIDLGAETKWMYVLVGNRANEADHLATRVFVTGPPGDNKIKAIDLRNNVPKVEWAYSSNKIQNAYMPPIAINLDQIGGDEIVHSTVAVDETGSQLWRHHFSKHSVLGAAHTLTVKDIDPSKPGLEAVYSIYGPRKGAPSLVSVAASKPASFNWEAYSPYPERHPHQHTVGDFDVKSEGLEVLARNKDGKNHWLIDAKGKLIFNKVRLASNHLPNDWNNGELVQGIEWDTYPGTEVLYTERHVNFREFPRLIIISSTPPIQAKTPLFHGGIDIGRIDEDTSLSDKPDPTLSTWFGYVNRPSQYNHDGPYEGAAHAIDLFGDGREEVLTWGAKKIVIYYNSGTTPVKKRRNDREYLNTKKLWINVYNPR